MRRSMLAVLAAVALPAAAVEIDGVAAKVGSETILKSDVIDEMRRMGLHDASRYEEIRNEMIDRDLNAGMIIRNNPDVRIRIIVIDGKMGKIIFRAVIHEQFFV